jgi:hypothetical protein
VEVGAPTNASAFVAFQSLDRLPGTPAAPVETGLAATTPAAATTNALPADSQTVPPTAVETVTTEPPPAAAVDAAPTTQPATSPVDTAGVATPPVPATGAPTNDIPADSTAGLLITSPGPEPAPAPELPRRIVTREGLVVFSRSIQAPTTYALESKETHRLINYLHTEELGLKLKNFAGRKVQVTGEELLDVRWQNTPILEVESIQIVP